MNVIIVDDERNARENLHMKIKEIPQITGIKLLESPFEAVAYTRENPVDIAFLDIEMPGITGVELAKRLKDVRPRLNIIFVTGHSEYALEAFGLNASDYLLKPARLEYIKSAIDHLRHPVPASGAHIRIQTFGSFAVFVDGKPLQITHSKARELLACLVDRRGASVSVTQIAAVLWADKVYTRSVQRQVQTVISRMMKTLRDAGIADIVVKSWNNLAVDINKFECDYYLFLKGDLASINTYAGEYMSEYDWAEMTADMLVSNK